MKTKIISIITLSLVLFTNSCTKDTEIEGCTYETACNYNQDATQDDGNCDYPEEFYDCDGACLEDTDNDGICDQLENTGCNNPNACNYNPTATDDDGSCIYPETYYDCYGNCISDFDNDGICDELELEGCLDEDACNYNPNATNIGECIYPEPGYDCNGDINDFYTVEQLFNLGVSFNEIANAGYTPQSITVTSISLSGCTLDSNWDFTFGCPDIKLEVWSTSGGLITTTGIYEDQCTQLNNVLVYNNYGFPFNIGTSLFTGISVDVEDDDGVGTDLIETSSFSPWNVIISYAQSNGSGNSNSSPTTFTVLDNDGTSCPTLTFEFNINW
jgi:hypothetical protein